MRIRSFIPVAVLLSAVILIFLAGGATVIAQMPDWVGLRDRDGNLIYMDQNGKIYCSGEPESGPRPVSADGIDYYINQGNELIKSHHKLEGLVMLKSILSLPQDDARVYKARAEASRLLNALIRNEGDRFRHLDAQASLLHIRVREVDSLINDYMGYRVNTRGRMKVVHSRMRSAESYVYHGVTAGLLLASPEKRSAVEGEYDAICALDAEMLSGPAIPIRRVEEHWRKTLGADTFARTLLDTDEHSIRYEFADTKGPYSGFEAFFQSGCRVYCLRIIAPERNYRANKAGLEEILRSFTVVR